MAKTIQDHYKLIKEGKGNKDLLLRKIKEAYPNYIPNHFTLEQALPILKQKGIIYDSKVNISEDKKDWINIFKKNLSESKAVEKKPNKEAVESETKGFDFKDKSNIDNIYGQAFLIGYYAEMKDPKNTDKTIDDLKAIVAKNLEKDPLYYVKDGQFGVKGLGYRDDLPGLKASKTDQMVPVPDQVKPKASKTDLGDREKKTGAAKKVKGEMSVVSKSSRGVKKMALPGKEKKIKLKEAWEGAEFDTGKFDDGPQPPENISAKLSDYDNMSDYDIIKWAEDDGYEEMIVKDGEGGLANRDELLRALLGLEIDNYYGDEDAEEWVNKQHGDLPNPAGSNNYLQEQKLRSIISKLIKEELNELDFPYDSPESVGTEWDMHTSKFNKIGRERSRFTHDREAKTPADYINSTFSKKIDRAYGILELEEVEEELLGTLMKNKDDEEIKIVIDNLLGKIEEKRNAFLNEENPAPWKDSKKGTVKLSKDKANPSDIKKYTDQDIDVDLTENEEIYQQIEDLEAELLNTTDPERAKEIEAKLDALTQKLI